MIKHLYSKIIMLLVVFIWSFISVSKEDGHLFLFAIGCVILIFFIEVIILKTKVLSHRATMYILLSIVAFIGTFNSQLDEMAGLLTVGIVLYPLLIAIIMEIMRVCVLFLYKTIYVYSLKNNISYKKSDL